ncbi:MAG: DUF2085 domain-containing protein [Ktedonobacterales bacterium]
MQNTQHTPIDDAAILAGSATSSPTPAEVAAKLDGFGPRRRDFNRVVSGFANGLLGGIQRHWLLILNGVLLVFIGIALLDPIAYALGFSGPGGGAFNVYHVFCAQTPSHSFYIFGYQTCLCSRCLAIYSSLLIGGLFFAMFRQRRDLLRIPNINWKVWALGMVPMALDGGTQLFGWHESNLFLRLLTGAIFGFMTAWFLLPQIEEAGQPAPAVATVQQRQATTPQANNRP